MATTPPPPPHAGADVPDAPAEAGSPADGPPTRRNVITVVAILVAMAVVAVVAFLVLDDGGEGDGSGEETLVGLHDGELVHHGPDGEVTRTFAVDLNGVDADDLVVHVVGSHLVAVHEGTVIAIDAASGEVRWAESNDGAELDAFLPALGSRRLLAFGNLEGTAQVGVVDLVSGERVELGEGDTEAEGEGRQGVSLPGHVVASPDGALVGLADYTRQGAEAASTVATMDGDEEFEVPGYVGGITEDRIVTFRRVEEGGEAAAVAHFLDHEGEERHRVSLPLPMRSTVLDDGTLVMLGEDGFSRVAEGDDEPQAVDGAEIDDPAEVRVITPVTDERLLLATDEEVVVLDRDLREIGRHAVPDIVFLDTSVPDRRCVPAAGVSRMAVVIDVETGERLTDPDDEVLGWSRSGCEVAVQDDDGIRMVGSDTVLDTDGLTSVAAVADDGSAVVTMASDGMRLWPTDGGEPVELTDERHWYGYVALD